MNCMRVFPVIYVFNFCMKFPKNLNLSQLSSYLSSFYNLILL